jgi:acid stress-induced BolA-like protein IbaG/YrbA
MHSTEIESTIRQGLPGSTVVVKSDDQTHFEALVVATQFDGKRPLARHQMVYALLGEAVGREIHALSIQAFTPSEWTLQKGG